ncbi:hypothetical protein A2348_04220 [Candidatus Uhrbacteria bacterium RIFOXYB12_FULL_58_10]|uniref:Uncharacterized protein n=1 Tax=Candidatus Uhrbacteria bacterium RIFOXYB2_FULL_57_15 TaxID=1802422 RepID=A0A1F7W7S0_9BACT|nr:MAG: hypothetical protein A2348_04220 [Candidatus Uhrbacteria bacterium RIFOXYB12_FULL_58_10]OGL98247.1 MAG: hypothetical protein A2304_00145 [Candidatus Uhrbacteria bacterium RIFOXYB2_FULL_57_15]
MAILLMVLALLAAILTTIHPSEWIMRPFIGMNGGGEIKEKLNEMEDRFGIVRMMGIITFLGTAYVVQLLVLLIAVPAFAVLAIRQDIGSLTAAIAAIIVTTVNATLTITLKLIPAEIVREPSRARRLVYSILECLGVAYLTYLALADVGILP